MEREPVALCSPRRQMFGQFLEPERDRAGRQRQRRTAMPGYGWAFAAVAELHKEPGLTRSG